MSIESTLLKQYIPLNVNYFDVYNGSQELANKAKVLNQWYAGGENNLRWVIDRYDEIYSKDAFIQYCINLRRHRIEAMDYEILCEIPQQTKRKRLITFTTRNLFYNINFHELLRYLLEALIFGFKMIEMDFAIINDYMQLKAIKPHYSAFWSFDKNLDYWYNPNGYLNEPESIRITGGVKNKFIHFAYNSENQNPYGRSVLDQGVYFLYLIKKEIRKLWYGCIAKYGQPLIYAYVNQIGLDEETKNKIAEYVDGIRNGSSVTLPKDAVEVVIPDLKRNEHSEMYSEFMRAIDHELCNNLTFSTLGSEYDKYGSNAKIETYASIMELSIINDAKQIEDVINTQVIKPLIDLNFGVQEVYPYVKFSVKKDKDIKAFMEAINLLVSLGGQVSEKYVRDYSNIPDPQNGELILSSIVQQQEDIDKKDNINNADINEDKGVDDNVQQQEKQTNNNE